MTSDKQTAAAEAAVLCDSDSRKRNGQHPVKQYLYDMIAYYRCCCSTALLFCNNGV